ncbi:transcriptional regulator, UvrC family [Enterococcus faecalis 02-MB-P-10]|nr:transcriptional regulator, UvrC family [Enterococcus faecalis 02-MB-P-10]
MQIFDYQGKIIPPDDHTRRVAYVSCSCGCLASCLSDMSNVYKCTWCKKKYSVNKKREVKEQTSPLPSHCIFR